MSASLYLGVQRPLDGSRAKEPLRLPAHHLVTHGVVVGMTGSGKTGLITVMIEEALRAEVPVLVIDVKGDLTNLLLSFPDFDPALMLPWVSTIKSPTDERSDEQLAAQLAQQRAEGLSMWDIGEPQLASYARSTSVLVITPGSTAGEQLHVLSSLERGSERWATDPESA